MGIEGGRRKIINHDFVQGHGIHRRGRDLQRSLHSKFRLGLQIFDTQVDFPVPVQSKIEKVPSDIRGEKSSKDTASSRNLVSTIGALASPKMGDGTRCPEG